MRKFLQVTFFLFYSINSIGQLTLVKDLTQTPADPVYPDESVSFQNSLFVGIEGELGKELWKTDGNTWSLVKDILPGRQSSNPHNFKVVNNTLFFVANNGIHGQELWKTDGTARGTLMIKNIAPAGSSFPYRLTDANGLLYFVAHDGIHGEELWQSDGSEGGTVMVKDIHNGSGPSNIENMTAVNGILYFTASDGVNGIELWKSSGGDAMLVKDIRLGTSSSFPTSLINFNGELFFSASDGINGRELWRSDGTSNGTTIVEDIFIGLSSSSPESLTPIDNILLFKATDASSGQELWKFDGTAVSLVKDIQAGPDDSWLSELHNFNGTLYFTADNGSSGLELWSSDGSSSGTTQIVDIEPGNSGSYPHSFTTIGNQLFFTCFTTNFGQELWITDGTGIGTKLVLDIQPDIDSGNPLGLVVNDNHLFFIANTTATFASVLWKSNGTPEGTAVVTPFPLSSTRASNISFITKIDNTIFFESNYALWKSDGTALGTTLLKDFSFWSPWTTMTPPQQFTVVNNILYFIAETENEGLELWKSDGTEAGTIMVRDILPGGVPNGASHSSHPDQLTNVNGVLYFSAVDLLKGRELWKSDGTEQGTVLVKDINIGGASDPFYLTNINGTLFFTANDGINGFELWTSNGTDIGTTLVKDICNACDSWPSGFVKVGSDIFFTADNGIGGILWKTDGTTAGTQVVNSTGAANLRNLNRELFFLSFDGISRGVWKSNGTPVGTMVVKDQFDSFGSVAADATESGVLYFAAQDAQHGLELWRTDGTTPGTVMVKDIAEGITNSNPSQFLQLNGLTYFVAHDGLERGLWRTDGTDAGTWKVGNEASILGTLVSFNDEIFLSGSNFSAGWGELWKYTPGPHLKVEPDNAFVSDVYSIHMDDVMAFSSGVPVSIKLLNIGSSDLSNFSVQVKGGNPNDFIIDSSELPIALSPGASAQLWVRFNPQGAGFRNGTIEIGTNEANLNPHILHIEGTAPKADQAISFTEIETKTFGDPSFNLIVTASSSLPIEFISSDPQIAAVNSTPSGVTISISGAGTVTITAKQNGNADYNPAPEIEQTLTIVKAIQTIPFEEFGLVTLDAEPIVLPATASSGLEITYTSDNSGVATIQGNILTITGAGEAFITAEQSGNSNYYSSSVIQELTVSAITNVEHDLENLTSIYPNPTTGIITVEIPAENKIHTTVKISNVLGGLVQEKELPTGGRTVTLDLAVLPSGVYLLTVKSGPSQFTRRIIKAD